MVSWPVDDARLERVRRLMHERDLDAIVARAPDNLVYLANYWPMKGYDFVVFPRDGEPTLIVIEPQLEEAQRAAWTDDVRAFRGYDEADARPPQIRGLDLAARVARERGIGRIGLELSMGTQATDRMVGEPTVPWLGLFEAFASTHDVVDATPLLTEARMVKTEQEIERMRLANDLARLGLEHVREHLRPGMRESEVGALFEARVHAEGVGYQGRVEMARAFTLVWSGPGIRTFTATGDRPVAEHEPTLLEIWVCADGYWTDLTKNLCPGRLTTEYERLLDILLDVYGEAVAFLRPGAELADLDRLIRAGIARSGHGPPSHPICHGVGARAHEPPYAHQAAAGTVVENMVLAVEPAIYLEGGGGLRLEDDFLIGRDGAEALCGFPDDIRLAMA